MSNALPLDPAKFTPRFEAAAPKAGFKVTPFGEIHGHPLLAYTKRSPGLRPRIYLSSGIHGDEPAPPWALLRLMEEGLFDDRCTWFICPLLNPTGFLHRTRENHAKVDLNRDYKSPQTIEVQAHIGWLRRQPNFDLIICVHEDWEAKGFYLYELNPGARPSLAEPMVAAVERGCPIDEATVIDGRPIDQRGIIRPTSDPLLRENWPEAIYLRAQHTSLGYTIETPSALPLAQRVAAQRAAVETALRLSTRG